MGAKTLLVTGGAPVATTAGATQYWFLSTATNFVSPTESNRQIVYRTPGLLSKLYVRITANSTSLDSTVFVRKNGSNASLSVTIPAGATGVFEDTTHTDSVAAGDRLNYRTVSGGTGTMTVAIISVIFTSDADGAVSRLTAGSASSAYTAASAFRCAQLVGQVSGGTNAENTAQSRIPTNGVIKNLAIYISGNARTTTTTVGVRTNGADSAITIAVGAGVTGILEDTSHTLSVAAGDLCNFSVVTLAGTEALTIQSMSLDFVSVSEGMLSTGQAQALTQSANVTNYCQIGGNIVAGTIEAERQTKTREGFRLSGLTISVLANTVSAPSTLTLRVNAVDTALSVNIPASSNGHFFNNTDVVVCDADDDINYRLTTGATGTSMVVRQIALNDMEYIAVVQAPASAGRQGRSPLYRRVLPKTVAVIIKLKVQLEYKVTKLTITAGVPYIFERPRPVIKYASAIITPIVNILPLRQRPTPKPVIRSITTQVSYQVQSIQLKSACAYQVDKLITHGQQSKLRTIATNFLLSDV